MAGRASDKGMRKRDPARIEVLMFKTSIEQTIKEKEE